MVLIYMATTNDLKTPKTFKGNFDVPVSPATGTAGLLFQGETLNCDLYSADRLPSPPQTDSGQGGWDPAQEIFEI